MDLTEDYKYERLRKDKLKSSSTPQTSEVPASSQETSAGGFFNFFGSSNTPSTSNTSSSSSSEVQSPDYSSTSETLDADEKRRRLAMRLKNMTDRIEEMSNQIYHLQQRIEVLEKKTNLGSYE